MDELERADSEFVKFGGFPNHVWWEMAKGGLLGYKRVNASRRYDSLPFSLSFFSSLIFNLTISACYYLLLFRSFPNDIMYNMLAFHFSPEPRLVILPGGGNCASG